MSYDFTFRKNCDHRIVKEQLTIRGNRQTIFLERPVQFVNSFQLYVNGQLIPQDHEELGYDLITDFFTEAEVVATTQPINVRSGFLYFLREDGVDITSLQIFDLYNPAVQYDVSNFEIEIDINDRYLLVTSDRNTIPDNTWVVLHYEYVADYFKVDASGQHRIQFKKAIYHNYIYEVSYVTDIFNCRQCHGFGVLNDFVIGNVGQYTRLSDTAKLEQDCYIYAFTIKGSDPIFKNLGTSLRLLVGTGNFGESTRVSAQSDLKDALEMLMRVQEEQYQYQDMTLDEVLENIESIEVTQDPNEVTLFTIRVVVRTLSTELVELSGEIDPNVVV